MKNEIKGGKGDNMTPKKIADKFDVDLDYVEKQIKKGENVESEHTDNKEKETEIATDHITEFPDYYDRLEKMEKQAEKYWSKKEKTNENKSFIKKILKENIQLEFTEDFFKTRIPFFKDFKFFKHPRYESKIEGQRVVYHENVKKLFQNEIFVFPQFNVSSEFIFDIQKIHDNVFYYFTLKNNFHFSQPSNMDDITFRVLRLAINQIEEKLSFSKEIMVKIGDELNKTELDEIINQINKTMFKIEEVSDENNTPLFESLTQSNSKSLVKKLLRENLGNKNVQQQIQAELQRLGLDPNTKVYMSGEPISCSRETEGEINEGIKDAITKALVVCSLIAGAVSCQKADTEIMYKYVYDDAGSIEYSNNNAQKVRNTCLVPYDHVLSPEEIKAEQDRLASKYASDPIKKIEVMNDTLVPMNTPTPNSPDINY